MENPNYIMREITPLSERDCFYIADRRKTEFTYPIHCHAEYELNFTEHASGVRRVVRGVKRNAINRVVRKNDNDFDN